jgi:hypothetical protein
VNSIRVFVNPHPVPDAYRLAQTTDQTLQSLIELHRGDIVGNDRLDAAGVPALNMLVAERLRRESAHVAVQR